MITCENGVFFLRTFSLPCAEDRRPRAGRQSVQAAEPVYMNKEVPLEYARENHTEMQRVKAEKLKPGQE